MSTTFALGVTAVCNNNGSASGTYIASPGRPRSRPRPVVHTRDWPPDATVVDRDCSFIAKASDRGRI